MKPLRMRSTDDSRSHRESGSCQRAYSSDPLAILADIIARDIEATDLTRNEQDALVESQASGG